MHFAKIVTSIFRRTFSCFGIKFGVSYQIKKDIFLQKKNAHHTVSIYGNCMTSFFDCDNKNFLKHFFEIEPKFYLRHFQLQNGFVLK